MMILQRKYLRQEIEELSIHELQNFANLWNINIDGIVEKNNIIDTINIFRRQFHDLHTKTITALNDIITNCNIKNITGSGKNGKIIKADLIKAIYGFIGEDPDRKTCRISIKILKCPYVYWLHSTWLFHSVEKIDENINNEYFRMKSKDLNLCYKEYRYHLESKHWLCGNEIIGDDTPALYHCRKACYFIETLTLYLTIKSVFSVNNIPLDILTNMMLLYCRYLDITDIRVIHF